MEVGERKKPPELKPEIRAEILRWLKREKKYGRVTFPMRVSTFEVLPEDIIIQTLTFTRRKMILPDGSWIWVAEDEFGRLIMPDI